MPFIASATSGLCFRRNLLHQIFPLPEDRRLLWLQDNYLKWVALSLCPTFFDSTALSIQRIHSSNQYTGRADTATVVLYMIIVSSWMKENYPEALTDWADAVFADGLGRYWRIESKPQNIRQTIRDYYRKLSRSKRVWVTARALASQWQLEKHAKSFLGAFKGLTERRLMRIFLVSDSYPPLIGGATRATQLLAHELVKRGHTVMVATAWQKNFPSREMDGEVEVARLRDLTSRAGWVSSDAHRHTPPPFPDPEATPRLRRLITRFRPDVVHAYGWLAYSAAAALEGLDVPRCCSRRATTATSARCGRLSGTVSTRAKTVAAPRPPKCLGWRDLFLWASQRCHRRGGCFGRPRPPAPKGHGVT